MRKKYGTIFISFVLVFVFQIVILDESFASFQTQQDACETTGNCPYPGNYGATSKNSHYHRIGTSIRANSIRQESDPQVTPYQYPNDPNSYAYNQNNLNYGQGEYYDPYRAAAVDPSIYDPNSGVPYGGYTDPGYTYGIPTYNNPNLVTPSTYPGYSITDQSNTYQYPGCYDPSVIGSYNDPSSGYSFTGYNYPPVDPEIDDDPGSGSSGGTLGGLGDFISGLGGIMNAAGAIGRMFGGQSAPTNAANPLMSATNFPSTATNPSSATSETSTGYSAISTLPVEGIYSDIGPALPLTSKSQTTTGASHISSDTRSLSDISSHTETPISQNSKSVNSLLDATGHKPAKGTQTSKNSKSLNSLRDTAGHSSDKGTQTSKNSNNVNSFSNAADHGSHSITCRNPNNVASFWDVADHSSHSHSSHSTTHRDPSNLASLWDAANYFNSKTEDNGKSDPMLIFIPSYLNRLVMGEKEYTPELSEDEIAKLYNTLGKKKRKSVLLLTDGDVNTPHGLFEEIYPPVLEETGGDRSLTETLGKHYQYIPFLEDSTGKLISGINLHTSAEDGGSSLINFSRIRKDDEDVMKKISDFYEVIPKEKDSSEKSAPGIEINSSAMKESSISTRVRKGNEDIMKKLGDFYEFIPFEMDSSQKPTTAIVPHPRKEGNTIMNIDNVRDSNNKVVVPRSNGNLPTLSGLELTESSGQLANDEITPIFLLTDDAESLLRTLNHSKQLRRDSYDVIKSMSEFYDFTPIEMDSSEKIAPATKIHTFEAEKSGENNSERVRKHNQDIIRSMSDFYDFIPIEMDSSDQAAPGSKIHTFEAEKTDENSSERVRKHNQDIIKSMSDFYDFIPIEMNSSNQSAPGTKIYSSEEDRSGKNNSERVKKHNNDIIMSMSDSYKFIPTGMNSFRRPSPGIQPDSTPDDYPTINGNVNKIINTQSEQDHGIMVVIGKDESTLNPRFYRLIPKIRPFIKSGIDTHSAVKHYILVDLKSKFKTNFYQNDKLLLIGNGVENSNEYLAKKRDHMIGDGDGSLCKTCEEIPETGEPSPKSCKLSPITCDQSPNKYIFRLTCYDPHSHCPHTGNKSFILHFDCLNKISPIITNILKTVENQHFGSSDCHTNETCKDHSHRGTNGDCFQNYCKTSPCCTCDSALNNQYNNNYNPIPTTDVNMLPVPISTGNKEEYPTDYKDFKRPTENVHTKPTLLKDTSSSNLEVNHSKQCEKLNRDDSVVIYNSSTMKSLTHPSSLPFDSSQPSNSPYETPRSTTVQSTPKLDLNIISDLSTPQSNSKSVNYQSGFDTVSKSSNFDSYYPPQAPPAGSSPPFSSTYEKSGTTTWSSIPKQDLSSWSSPPKTHPTFYPETQESRLHAPSTSSNHEIETNSFQQQLPSYPLTPPTATPSHECLNIRQPSPTKCEQKCFIEEKHACTKSPAYEIGVDCEKFKENVYDFPQVPTVQNGRSSIMTISKCDNHKPKYLDELKDMGIDQCKTSENATIVIEKRISDAIETLLNTSLQSCCKDKEISPSLLFTESGNTNKPCSTVVKPACPINTNGGACSDDLTAHQCPDIPKCHLKEQLCTKHTQEISKNQNSTKFVHGFECKKTIQSNHCIDSIGPCNCKTDCKILPPPASKECETLANFLEKISQTLDKSSCKENESKECKCKCSA